MSTGFYTAAEAARIARVPRSTVNYWATTELITPSGRKRRPRLYTFTDLRDLVVAEQLRRQGARVQDLRAAVRYVRSRDLIERLAQANFRVADGQLVFETESGPVAPHMGGQRVFEVRWADVLQQLGASPGNPMVLRPSDRVLIDPAVRGGTPVIDGTRIPTRLLRELIDDGLNTEEVLHLYPALSREDLEAGLKWEQDQDERAVA